MRRSLPAEPMPEAARRAAEEYLEKLRKYRPEEYEQIMKQREASKKRKQAMEKPNGEAS